MNEEEIKKKVLQIMEERERLKQQLIEIAYKIDNRRPWKVVLRELGVVI